MRGLAILFLLSLLILPGLAAAHGLFWQAADGGYVLMEGHPPGHGHGGEAAVPLPPSRALAVLVGVCAGGIGASAEVWTEAAVPDSGQVFAPDGAAVFAEVDWGWWTTTADGTVNRHPDQVPGALKAWRSRETVKHVARLCWSAPAKTGRGLELCPAEDPARLRPGDKLTVVVTLDGQPVADAVVAYAGRARGTTGPDGTVRLKLREPGLQMIRASLRRPAAAPAPPWAEDVRSAVLTFVPGDE